MTICKLAQGSLNFTVNGDIYEVTEDDITIQPDSFIREPQSNGRFTDKRTSPWISGSMHVPVGKRVTDLLGLCDSVVVLQEQNGRTWILSNASITHEEGPYDVQSGKFRFKMIGQSMRELVGQGAHPQTTAA